MSVAKKELRKRLLYLLSSFPHSLFLSQGKNVQAQVLASDAYKQNKHIGVYIAMKGEMPTSDIIDDILRPESQKICYIPYIETGPNARIRMLRVTSQKDLNTFKPNKWGILEPIDPYSRVDALKEGTLDLLIVPGLAFNPSGARCGRGKGFYDQFIRESEEVMKAHKKKSPITIGIGFSFQNVVDIPMGKNDVYLNSVIFPKIFDTSPSPSQSVTENQSLSDDTSSKMANVQQEKPIYFISDISC